MSKTTEDGEKEITSVRKDTNANGKFRITMEIPEEYRGYKNYTMLHEHNGEVVTLVDLDDNPNTITFEVDKFSTFVLAASNEETTDDAWIQGDANGDDLVDVQDILFTLRGYLRGETDVRMDMNDDGKITLLDILKMLKASVA